jgi:hypothetical protein
VERTRGRRSTQASSTDSGPCFGNPLVGKHLWAFEDVEGGTLDAVSADTCTARFCYRADDASECDADHVGTLTLVGADEFRVDAAYRDFSALLARELTCDEARIDVRGCPLISCVLENFDDMMVARILPLTAPGKDFEGVVRVTEIPWPGKRQAGEDAMRYIGTTCGALGSGDE